jgi:dinuclear metal center YbgI/SA1388 family protein
MVKLEHLLHFLEDTFRVSEFPDFPHALNGLQVEGPDSVEKIATAVDASEETIRAAVDRGVQLLLVHHGLFWDGFGRLTGPRFRKAAALIRGGAGLYSLHLPLDAHPELGNCALLVRMLGLSPEDRFGSYEEMPVGWWAAASLSREELRDRLRLAVGGDPTLVPGGPETVSRIGVLTGSGSGSLAEAAALRLDTLITGEAPHHAYHDAMEMGINLMLGGHYATETLGVKALGDRLAQEFQVSCEFLEYPTGF